MSSPHDFDDDLPVNLASQRFAVIPPINIDSRQCYPLAPKPPETPRLKSSRSHKKKKKVYPPSLMTDLNLKENFCLNVLPKIGENRENASPPLKLALHERDYNYEGSERRLCQKVDRSQTEILGFEISDYRRSISQSSEDEFVLNSEDVALTSAQRNAINALNRLEETMVAISRPTSPLKYETRPPTRKNVGTRREARNFTPKVDETEECWRDSRIERLKERAVNSYAEFMDGVESEAMEDKTAGKFSKAGGGIIKMASGYDGSKFFC